MFGNQNVTFSGEEAQKIGYVLEIYHHCFFSLIKFRKVEFLLCAVCLHKSPFSFVVKGIYVNPQLCPRDNIDP